MIAALYVERGGTYWDLPGIDPWDVKRDARTYSGPDRVIAHPPCQRWGRFWHGSPRKPHQYRKGEDMGCFACALTSVRNYGGVLEHPADSLAYDWFGITKPPRTGGWVEADAYGYVCHVEQGHYGHNGRKATWLYAVDTTRPELTWGPSPQRLDPVVLERHGYEYARRKGIVSMVGGKRKQEIRNATPKPFRDLLITLVRGYP